MKDVTINHKTYQVNDSEYNIETNKPQFCNLKILQHVGEHERVISLLSEINQLVLMSSSKKYTQLVSIGVTHGGYMEIQLATKFHSIYYSCNDDHNNIQTNILHHKISNITTTRQKPIHEEIIVKCENQEIQEILSGYGDIANIFVLINCKNEKQIVLDKYKIYILSRTSCEIAVLVTLHLVDIFEMHFQYYLQQKNSNLLEYDNLIHYALMVKNGGETLREVIRANLPFIDEYTILDTGSTDGTVELLQEEFNTHKKKGKIIREPFLNFRDSRNRCLELCGQRCKYIVMLDDTYILRNDLRLFLESVRGDQFSDSFSMYILSDDVEYGSNRIIRSDRKHLRYKYKIHEVITPVNNNNVIIPKEFAYIFDVRSDYMEERTMTRKQYDIEILNEMVADDPADSRAYYYLGQTYNLLNEYEKAYENFLQRVNHPDEGFIQEKIDAYFEAARLANFQLANKPWAEVEALYEKAYELDRSRPDSLYFIGIHYYMSGEFGKAYGYFKQAYAVGYPEHCQYSLKPSLSYYYLPKFLVEVCYHMKDYALGYEVCQFFTEHEKKREGNWWKKIDPGMLEVDIYTMKCWEKIYGHILVSKNPSFTAQVEEIKKRLIFIVNGGFATWRGSDILKKGMGGSETFIVEISKYIRKNNYGEFEEVIVFCNCGEDGEEEYEGVLYRDLRKYQDYLDANYCDLVVVSRYPEYLGALYNHKNVEKVMLILHDLIPSGEVMLRHEKLSKIMLLSQYHKNVFDGMFGTLRDLTTVFGYGVSGPGIDSAGGKVKNRFIYSSMANRGLYYLLLMWRDIRKVLVDATLYIHCEIYNHKWLDSLCKEEMEDIRRMVKDLEKEGVVYKGWVGKKELYTSWAEAEVWFYPTTFLETFCLTALEAGISKTLVVTMNVGSLPEVVGDRGVVLNYNVMTEEGRGKILGELFVAVKKKKDYIERNYRHCMGLSWEDRAREFI
jgi:glycosyltransferase involved in cell wall biosynthesis